MKNTYIIILFTILITACSDSNIERIKRINDLEKNRFIGKINFIETTNYEVVEHKFGKPIFEKRYSKKDLYNNFGYRTKYNFIYTSKYANSLDSTLISYHEPSIGLVSRIIKHNETDYPEFNEKSILTSSQIFTIDSISNKITSSETIDVTNGESYFNKSNKLSDLKRKPEIIKSYKYNHNEDRVSSYEKNSLKELEIINYDTKGRIIKNVKYDKAGNETYGNYRNYIKDVIARDSTVNKSGKETTVTNFDSFGRVKSINSNKISYNLKYQYDNDNINSSFNIFEVSRKDSTTIKKKRIEITVDEIGNVLEKVKTNLDSKKIIEKTIYKYKYY